MVGLALYSRILMLSNRGFAIAIVSFFRYSLALTYSSGDGSFQ
jgi:hypothetical protein